MCDVRRYSKGIILSIYLVYGITRKLESVQTKTFGTRPKIKIFCSHHKWIPCFAIFHIFSWLPCFPFFSCVFFTILISFLWIKQLVTLSSMWHILNIPMYWIDKLQTRVFVYQLIIISLFCRHVSFFSGFCVEFSTCTHYGIVIVFFQSFSGCRLISLELIFLMCHVTYLPIMIIVIFSSIRAQNVVFINFYSWFHFRLWNILCFSFYVLYWSPITYFWGLCFNSHQSKGNLRFDLIFHLNLQLRKKERTVYWTKS